MSISLSVRLIYDPEFKALFFPQAPGLLPIHFPFFHIFLAAIIHSHSPSLQASAAR